MRQPTKGPVLKERVWCFLEALLTCAEGSHDFAIHWETDKNTGRPNLVVKTKRRFLESLTQLKPHEIYEVIESLEKLEIWDDRRLKRGKGSEIGFFALKLWSTDAPRNREQFEQAWEGSRTAKSKALEATYNRSKDSAEASQSEIDWHNICLAMLENQKRLTTNLLLSADEDMRFELDDIHVPLALVQRTKPDKRSGDVSPEEGSRLLQPTYEEKQRFRHDEFLAQVLQEGKGQSQGRRIAVIGEPGAGKTTLLQSIAFWLLKDQNQNLGLPIWISLADLQGKTLEKYLLETWLKNALEVVRVTPEQENALLELFKNNRVWLLLDGVDEIAAASHESPLQIVESQLKGWVVKARVVLTCRLNVWEANLNALGDDFEKYRLLDFDYPLQVKEFICRWFRKTDADKGERLWAELDKSERQRIQDLVKNPLRLALLCSTWQSSDKGLPSTKAALYQRFVEVFYTWKKNRFPTTFEQRQELNAALGRLALKAMDSEESRFRLRHKVVCEVLGDPEQEGSLFGLALQLGWLNKVGLAAESETEEKVYAFYHPTFQEYFAALAIDDWHFFLNHVPHNPAQGIYRIFEPQLKEVILLWLGREEVTKEQKEEFIRRLVEFEDGFQGLYWFQNYFLAAAGIAEFEDCSRADEIVAQIVQWALGCFNDIIGWQSFYPLDKKATTVLKETLPNKAILTLNELLHVCQDEQIRQKVAKKNGTSFDEVIIGQVALTLLEFSPNNLEATTALKELINKSLDDFFPPFLKGIEFDEQIKIIHGLVFSDSPYVQTLTKSLEEYKGSTSEEIIDLIDSLSSKKEVECFLRLKEIVTGNPEAISPVVEVIKRALRSDPSTDYYPLFEAIQCMRRIGRGSPEAISVLIEVVNNDLDYGTYAMIRCNAILALGTIGAGNQDVFNFLINLVHNENDWTMRLNALGSLAAILRRDLFGSAVANLRGYLQDSVCKNNRALYTNCYWTLWHCAQNMTYPAFYQAWQQQEGVEKTTTSNSQSLNQANLPQSLQSAITNDPQLSQIIHLICIDGSQFIDPNNPAAKIYAEMVKRGCPRCDDGTPKMMAELQVYWDLLETEGDKCVVLVFYSSSTHTTSANNTAMSCPYSETFLSDLSKFGDRVCVVTNQAFDHIHLKFFTPSQAIEDVTKWIRAIAIRVVSK